MNISSNRARSPRFRSLLDHAHLRHYLLKADCLVVVGCSCVYTQGKCILFRQTITNYMEDCFNFFFFCTAVLKQSNWLAHCSTNCPSIHWDSTTAPKTFSRSNGKGIQKIRLATFLHHLLELQYFPLEWEKQVC